MIQRKRSGRERIFGGLSILLVTASSTLAQSHREYAIFDFADRPVDQVSEGRGINQRGAVAGRFNHDPYTRGGLWYRNSVRFIKPLGPARHLWSHGDDINDRDEVVGWTMSNPDYEQRHAFLWKDGDTIDLGTIGGRWSEAEGVNNSSIVVGWAESIQPDVFSEAFIWHNGTMRALPRYSSNAHATEAWDINDSGQVVGDEYAEIDGDVLQSALLWEGGIVQRLVPFQAKDWTFALGINELEQIVGGTGHRAFLWENGVMRDIQQDWLGIDHGFGTGINNRTQVVGIGADVDMHIAYPWLWENDVMTELSEFLPGRSGWTLEYAWDINDAGQITGGGAHGPGDSHAFMMSPVTSEMNLSAPVPGRAGEQNVITASACVPGERVYIMYGKSGGGTYVPGCEVLHAAVQIDHAEVAGSAIADAAGTAVITVAVPASKAGARVFMQAVNRASCQESQLIDVVFE